LRYPVVDRSASRTILTVVQRVELRSAQDFEQERPHVQGQSSMAALW
jgi:hypothetical protein